MRLIQKFSVVLILFGLALALLLLPQPSVSSAPHMSTHAIPANAASQSAAEEPVPAFHTQPPQGALPATMSPDTFSDPLVQNAYAAAARVKKFSTRNLAIAIATAARATAACSTASSANTAPVARFACAKIFTPMSNRAKEKLRRRFAKASFAANGNPSTSASTRIRFPSPTSELIQPLSNAAPVIFTNSKGAL